MTEPQPWTQHHHWGVIEHGLKQQIWQETITDEYFWEFMTHEELLEHKLGLETTHNFIVSGGGFELIDEAHFNSHSRTLTLWAYHANPKMLTWISLQSG